MLAFADEGDGQPLVLLHGISGNRTRWKPVTDLLLDSFRCVRVDLPGHGESADEGCDLLSAVAAVQDVIEVLELHDPIVVGHSMGANVALLHAALDGPKATVAVDGVPLHLPHLADSLAPFRSRLEGDDFPAAFAEWEHRLGAPEDVRSDVSQDVVLSYWANALDPERAAAVQPTFNAALSSISIPVLMCLASPPTPEDQVVLDGMSTTTVEIWPGGHFLHLADPARFAARLRALA